MDDASTCKEQPFNNCRTDTMMQERIEYAHEVDVSNEDRYKEKPTLSLTSATTTSRDGLLYEDFPIGRSAKQSMGGMGANVTSIKCDPCTDRLSCQTQIRDNGKAPESTLLATRMQQVSAQVKETLKIVAAMTSTGSSTTTIRAATMNLLISDALNHVESAVASGVLVDVVEEDVINETKYRFANDTIGQTIYNTWIPTGERDIFHLAIARTLLKNLSDQQLDDFLPLVIQQMMLGVSCMKNQNERYATAGLCLRAASAKGTDFMTVAKWLDFAIGLLPEQCWRDEYDISLSLYTMAAEVSYAVGDMSLAQQRVEIVLTNAREFDHKIQAYCTKINALNVSTKMEEAIDLGLYVLRKLNHPILHTHPTSSYVMMEYMRMKRFMKKKTIEKLRRLPLMTNEHKAAVMQICNLLSLPCMLLRPFLWPLLAFCAVRITVTHGVCAVSAVAFGQYGLIMVGQRNPGEQQQAYEYAELSLELLERFDTKQWLPRVYMLSHGMIGNWTKDLLSSMQPLERGYKVGIKTGDYEFALLCKYIRSTLMFTTGTPLPLVKKEMASYREHMIVLKQESMLFVHSDLNFIVESLMEIDSMEAFDQKVMIHKQSSEGAGGAADLGMMVKSWHLCRRLIMTYMTCDYARAASDATDLRGVSKLPKISIDMVNIFLFDALTRIAYCKSTGKTSGMNLIVIRRRISVIKTFAKRNPRFCLAMLVFVEAELAALKGKTDIAAEKYFSCISMFAHSKLLHLQAMACERAGKFMMESGTRDIAKKYFLEAHAAFEEWGAKGKCRVLRSEMEALFGKWNSEALIRPFHTD